MTAIQTDEGWLFLAAMVGLFARRVVGWSAGSSNDAHCAALRHAVRQRRPQRGPLHHSDRGSPYASHEYRKLLAVHGFDQSMSRKGDCWNNAVAESFFATLKMEYIDHVRFTMRDAVAEGLRHYIENFYNLERRHSTLGYISPVEYELRSHAMLRVA